jgi:hypothetical protein
MRSVLRSCPSFDRTPEQPAPGVTPGHKPSSDRHPVSTTDRETGTLSLAAPCPSKRSRNSPLNTRDVYLVSRTRTFRGSKLRDTFRTTEPNHRACPSRAVDSIDTLPSCLPPDDLLTASDDIARDRFTNDHETVLLEMIDLQRGQQPLNRPPGTAWGQLRRSAHRAHLARAYRRHGEFQTHSLENERSAGWGER